MSPTPTQATAAGNPWPGVCEPSCTLLAHFLTRVTDEDDAPALARRLLTQHGDLNGVCAAAADDGWPDGLAAPVISELRRLQAFAETLTRPVRIDRQSISSWTALVAYVRTALAGLSREQARVLYLDKLNRLLADEWIADGTVDHAPLYPREVILGALKRSASALILVHNHPSGDPSPSAADIALTRQIVDAGKVMGVAVHDHVVVGRDGVTSFRQAGLL
ncbi:JAB domain-containing protein [Brevundimonas diminuta]|uniref:JAB domain-containing protein n=1 Tax=Brevundimonas diminuta TaxID=293 RepID=UPI003F7D8A6A